MGIYLRRRVRGRCRGPGPRRCRLRHSAPAAPPGPSSPMRGADHVRLAARLDLLRTAPTPVQVTGRSTPAPRGWRRHGGRRATPTASSLQVTEHGHRHRRGIGVAVITSTCGRDPIAFSRSASRCSTRNRCCSSMTTRPGRRTAHGPEQRVRPIRIPASPANASRGRCGAPPCPWTRSGGRPRSRARCRRAGRRWRAGRTAGIDRLPLGGHLGGREQRGLPARVDHLEHGADRDDRFAGSDLSLEQPVHGIGARQVLGEDLATYCCPR